MNKLGTYMLTQDNPIFQELFGTKQCYSLRPVVGPENMAAFFKNHFTSRKKKSCLIIEATEWIITYSVKSFPKIMTFFGKKITIKENGERERCPEFACEKAYL